MVKYSDALCDWFPYFHLYELFNELENDIVSNILWNEEGHEIKL